MRYLMLIAIVIVACSFTIREKLVKKDNGWEMYVYPDCEDSTTYFKQIYYLKDIYREKNKRGEWIEYAGEYDIAEFFCLHDFICRTSSYVFRHNDTFFTDKVYYSEENSEEFYRKVMVKYRSIKTEKYDIQVEYYNNGTFKNFSIITYVDGNWRRASTEWDSLHSERWEGIYKQDRLNERRDSVFTEDKFNAINTEIITYDSIIKNGLWKKYNNQNETLDSIYYPDPKR